MLNINEQSISIKKVNPDICCFNKKVLNMSVKRNVNHFSASDLQYIKACLCINHTARLLSFDLVIWHKRAVNRKSSHLKISL